MPIRVLLLLLCCVLLFSAVSGCGSRQTAATSGKTPQRTPPSLQQGGGGPVATPLRQTAGVVAVKVRPQSSVAAPAWPGLNPTEPANLPKLAASVKSASDTATLLTREASSFDGALPLRGVNANFASAVFSPNWTAQNPNNTRLAYATYRFSTTGYTGLPTISIVWGDGPADFSTYYVAVANRQRGTWEWFEGPIDNVITLPSLNAYKNGAGELLVMVALTGTKQCTLSSVSVGPEETRGTGNSGLGNGGGTGGNGSPPLFGGNLPSNVDLSPQCAPIRNQGQLGSCTAFAIGSGALNYEMRRLYGDLGWDFGNNSEEIGPRYLYVETGKTQGLPCDATGRYYDQVVTWLKQNGIALEANAPYLPTPCADNWSAAVTGDAAVIRPAVGEAVACTTDAGITQIKTLLAQGRVLPVGTLLDDAFMNWTAGSAPWSYQGPAQGGHAMCIVGYDDAKQAFKVRNSWGPEWGENGHIWIAYNSLKNTAAGAMCFKIEMEYSQSLVNRLFGGGGNVFPPPTGVAATDGTHTDRVKVTWNAVAGAASYKVYRDGQTTPVGTVNAPAVSYDDMAVADGFSHTYWVKSVKPGSESSFSASDTGYVDGGGGGGVAPTIYGIYYTEGNVGDQAQFYVDYYSDSTPSFSWTLGGCNPGSSTAEAPTATYVTGGIQTISVTVTNASGDASLSGEIFVGGGGTAPSAVLSANPTSGTAPLTVTLDASASTDDGFIYRYDWDWEGDGVFDYTSDQFSVISVDFPAGTWNVTCRVWDYDGMSGDDSQTITVTGGGGGGYTELENNDDFSLASAINFGSTDIGSCGTGAGYPGYDGDIDDVWGFEVTTPLTFEVDMLLDSGTGDLDLYLYDAFGNLGGWSENSGSTEAVQLFLNPGIYYIVVHGFSGYSDYELTYFAF